MRLGTSSVVHAAGVVHRDIKLENILVGKDGRAALSDFGISRIVDDRLRREVAVTRTVASSDVPMKTVLGTVAYLAPEVRTGNTPTAASDLYAIGVALFRLLTGLRYESGPHAFDLLAPFDRRWRVVLGSLLAADPAQRRAEPFRPARHMPVWTRIVLLVVGLVVLLAGTMSAVRRWTVRPVVTDPAVAVEDEFSIPESVR